MQNANKVIVDRKFENYANWEPANKTIRLEKDASKNGYCEKERFTPKHTKKYKSTDSIKRKIYFTKIQKNTSQ